MPAGGDFQAALDAVQPGGLILLEAGATFTGPFTLPRKTGDAWITVRSAVPDLPETVMELSADASVSSLPPPGTRINPARAHLMPKLEAPSEAVIVAAPGAHHFRFIGIEIKPSPGTFLPTLVRLGAGTEASEDALPHDIVFERCYIHGDPAVGSRRGIALNGRNLAVLDSYVSDFKEVGADSQAIAGWNGPGPFKIVNNYLEAAGENLLFGGADPAIPNLVPSDIEIRGNHFSKPLSWKADETSFAGIPWSVKNLLELKNARRVQIEGNVFEHNWVDAQDGHAILFTVRNQRGGAPWSVVEDVTFTNNIVRHAASGINILGHDNTFPSQQTKRILIRNNLFDDIGGSKWGGGGRLFQLLNGTADVAIDHNTAFHTGNIITADGMPHTGFVYSNNIARRNNFGVTGSGAGEGNDTLDTFFPGHVFERNVLVGGDPVLYPSGNFFPASLDDVGFTNLAGGDFRLAGISPFKNAGTDGKDIGVDLATLNLASAGAIVGTRGTPGTSP